MSCFNGYGLISALPNSVVPFSKSQKPLRYSKGRQMCHKCVFSSKPDGQNA